MIVSTMRRILGALAALLAALVVLGLVGLWRISSGPLDVAALTPLIENTLGDYFSGATVEIAAARVEWAGWRRLLEVRLDKAALVDTDGAEIARVPRIDVTLDVAALVRQRIVPKAVTIYEPAVYLKRGKDGFEIRLLDDEGDPAVPFTAVERLWAPAKRDNSAGGRLQQIEIVNGSIVLEDDVRGRRWSLPASSARIRRVADGAVEGEVLLDIVTADETSDLVVMGSYRPASATWEAAVAFGDLRPEAFAALDPALATLAAADLPISGTVTVSGTDAGEVTAIGFVVSADAGRIAVPADVFAAIGGPETAQAVGVESLALRGSWSMTDRRVEIARFAATLTPGSVLRWPGEPGLTARVRSVTGRGRFLQERSRLEWEDVRLDLGGDGALRTAGVPGLDVPLRSISMSGAWNVDSRRLDLAPLVADLHGPALTATATVTGPARARVVNVRASLSAVAADSIDRLWPTGFQENARAWVTERLSDGRITNSSAEFSITIGYDRRPKLDALSGAMTFEDVTVDYLPPLPPIEAVNAVATLTKDSIVFDVTSGTAAGILLDRGTVALEDIAGDEAHAAIDTQVRGAVPRIFALLDHPPLNYARAVGIDPQATAGDADVRFVATVPLIRDVPADRVKVFAEANLENVRIADVVLGRDIRDGRLALRVDNNGVDLTGSGTLAAIEGTLVARENFSPTAPFRRRIEIEVPRAEVEAVEKLFLAETKIPPDLLQGTVAADIHITRNFGDAAEIMAELNFGGAMASVPYFGWMKPRDAPASARIIAAFQADTLHAVPHFSVDAAGLHLHGEATFDADERLERLVLERVATGRTNAAGSFEQLDDGDWIVTIRGRSVDLQPLIDDLDPEALRAIGEATDETDVAVTVDVETVWTDRDRGLRDLQGMVVQDGGILRSAAIEGTAEDGSRIGMLIKPDEQGNRVLAATAENAGAALRTFGLFDSMTGGTLAIEGTFDDDRPSRPLEGRLTVRDYNVKNAPALTKFLGMLALTEIGNTLRGEGLSFKILDVPFTYNDGLVTIDDARASGLALGFTAGGTVDIPTGAIDLSGTVVPVYAINSALGRLPVVGFLFRGDEKGSGVFAATYAMSGTFDDVHVMVNPLAALAPGMLRHMFDVFEGPAGREPQVVPAFPTGED